MSIKTKIFEVCKAACQRKEPTELDGFTLLEYVRPYVNRFNYENQHWFVEVEKINGNIWVTGKVRVEEPKKSNSFKDQIMGMTMDLGGDIDATMRHYFQSALLYDFAQITDPINKYRARQVVKLWNEQQGSDVVVARHAGNLCLYRKSWLKKRQLGQAVGLWMREHGMK